MELKDQVISLDLAKRLKLFGVSQAAQFYYVIPEGGQDKDRFLNWIQSPHWCDNCSFNHDPIAAFTVAELGEILPKNRVWYSQPGFLDRAWTCTVMHPEIESQYREFGETEAEARGLMLAYLLEDKII